MQKTRHELALRRLTKARMAEVIKRARRLLQAASAWWQVGMGVAHEGARVPGLIAARFDTPRYRWSSASL